MCTSGHRTELDAQVTIRLGQSEPLTVGVPLTPIREWVDIAGADQCHALSQQGCLERDAAASYPPNRASR